MNPRALVYDLEILNAIPSPKEEVIPGITYCKGWGDHFNMGISVLGAYSYIHDEYRIFCADNLQEFLDLVCEHDYVVGFNSYRFDRKVVQAVMQCETSHGQHFELKDYDILAEVWRGVGLDPNKFYWKTHGGFGLGEMCKINGMPPKRLDGALAPIAWQQGRTGQVIDYCLDDVIKTKKLLDIIIRDGALYNPKIPGTLIQMRRPWIGNS